MITLSPDINGVIFGRFLGGVFAASVPVAQAKKKKSVTGLLLPLERMSLHTPAYLNRHTYDACCAGGRHGPLVVHTYRGLVE
jgi:hypothetical protein